MERVAQEGRDRTSFDLKGTGENGMILEDVIFGILSSAIVAYVNRIDDDIDDAQKKRLEDLKRRIEAMRHWDSPDKQVTTLVNEALRDHHQSGNLSAALVKIVPTDPVWGIDLAQWMLEPDPKQFACKLDSLATRLAEASGCEKSAVAAFLTRVSRRIDGHLDLSQLRADKKLNLILVRLCAFEELRDLVERSQFTFLASFDKWLTDEQRKVLIPVCPVARDRTERNSLLSGSRPTDDDMHQNLDFERFVFKDVIAAIKAVDTFPCVFLFKAEPQKGKTTFLKRVGWHLAQCRYPVLRLAESARAEPYAHWIEDCTAEQTSLPLVVLIDDPANQREHFTNQLEALRQRDSRVVILLASRSLDWDQVNKDQCPLISDRDLRTRTFELNPRRGEERRLLEKLVSCGLLGVDRFDEVIKEVEEIPFGERYFHRVIEAATDERNRPISAMVEEALREAVGSLDAGAFERFYAMVCVPGMLGLPLPERVAQIVFPDDAERARALAFNEKLPRPAIRVSNPDYSVTHEAYAAEFLAPRDIVAETRSFVRAFVAQPELGDYVGRLLAVQRMRGFTEMVTALWDEIADLVTDDHWRACSAKGLTGDWGSFLYHLERMRPSLRANAVAVEKAPELAIAHSNYALLLEEVNEPQAAQTHYEEALRINPEFAWAHNNYAVLLKELKEPQAARTHYEEAVRINPEFAEAHSNYAGLLNELNEPQAARTHYEAALRINPEFAAAHNNYANLLKALNEPQAARTHYEEALRINPEFPEAHNSYALLLNDQQEPQAARTHYEEALRIDPEFAGAHSNYARFLLAQGELPLSLDHAVRAIRLRALPGGGTRIPGWFADHVDDLFQVVKSSDAAPERRGGALAFLGALKDERTQELVRQWDEDPALAPAAEVCSEILVCWTEALKQDTTEPPPTNGSAE